ncbi:hypothetical protein BD309DRAFT_972835 [Dichomitus squalens]|uniref:DUF6699 domain-containing protein n=1 Tax=Dichomitus squalens TaxID=114155 RepID=A0A4Q9NAU2_9APHY|nr:hypothetical protein BD309DRAFT_972835 [Dichomitus squalens]TBU60739.1 hypothetical protein BD310DRAFT_921972 [Dichomitus squalens]
MGWAPGHAPYPQQWAGGSNSPPPPRHPIYIPLPPVAPYRPNQDLGNTLRYYPPGAPLNPLVETRPRAPVPGPRQNIPRVPHHQPRTPSPDVDHRPLPRPLPSSVRVARGLAADTRPALNPILAAPEPPFGMLGLDWDLADHPIRNLSREENRWVDVRELNGAAVCANTREGSRPLERLVLMFAGLPVEIEVTHTHPASGRGGRADWDVPYVTVRDVFHAIFDWVKAPIEEGEMAMLDEPLFARVVEAAEMRRRWRPLGWDDSTGAHFLRIDYLGARRHFRGIRPARREEIPARRRVDEVFVVELGQSE